MKRTSAALLPIVLFCAAFAAAAALAAQITLYCDDFWYATFLQNGLSSFWDLTKWHYLHFNGRAFVHFALEVALLGETKAYIVLCPAMLSLIFLLGCRLQSPKAERSGLLLAAAVGIMAVLALPVAQLRESLLWMSAAFNYVFPLCVLLPALYCYTREKRGAACALALLAGATTIAAFGTLWLARALRERKPELRALLPAVLAALGWCTILFAPGTATRIGNEIGEGVSSVFSDGVLVSRFRAYMSYFLGSRSRPALVIALALLTALRPMVRRDGRRAPLLGFPAAAAYLALLLLHRDTAAELLALAYLIYAAVCCLMDEETALRGALLSGALVSQLVMLMTTTAAYRTTLPAVLLLLTVCLSLALDLLRDVPAQVPAALAALMLCLALIGYVPTLRGYARNAVINRANEAVLRSQSDELGVIGLDLDSRCRYLTYYDSGSFLVTAAEHYGTRRDKHVSYSSDEQTVAGMYGNRAFGLPAIERDGVWYFPAAFTTWLLDGQVGEWNFRHGGIVVLHRDRAFLISGGGAVYRWDAEAGAPGEQVTETSVIVPSYTQYVPASLFEELFGVKAEYGAAERIFYLIDE